METEVGSAWRAVPDAQVRRFTELARGEIPVLAQDILREIRQEYPGLPVILDSNGVPMSLIGIRRALEHFVEHLATGLGHPHVHPPVFQEFGRGELLEGRSLDSLQAIYRLGVRLAWRRLAEIGQEVQIPAPAMYELAESGFQYLDGLVAESVRGYAEAAARRAGERLRLQRGLLDLLLAEHDEEPPSPAAIAERAARIGWALPETVAVAVLLRPAREAVPPAVGPDVLLDMERERPILVVPEPDAAGRAELLRRTVSGWHGAVGPPVPLEQAAKSLRWAQQAVSLIEDGLLPGGGLVDCTEHTEALVLLPPRELIDDLGRRLLAPLNDCGTAHGRRLAETLLAWLETRGGAPEIATRLGVHPQTVRYRLRQIRELWGDGIDDPDHRFQLELVLRAKRLRGDLG
ncbi:helix-turn-helix domain-containing protein [Streptomyces alkaliterrae]|uniref:Helix-turn-helix domain-containing protein n=1 Tax=Streptomyces alkaliterrae TaxID=2213162 RepID=A0A5P0YNL8_9ACTN|nr:PucR family transcriptional regulator [Streptomyces alkaliterrae]MBB1253739.1 helix-turn-helix domain-containing protein [Streptomyces alkaliterrae]MBB1260248.1 helix-turn-helix domain-containing protein [Streptomyces alkaliterrae]MQS01906.1 PucR family transcriptional regulator [Streptomyces alkaliterrae]